MKHALAQLVARWKRDPVAFITEALRDPETGRPFKLYDAKVKFLRLALTLTPEGKLRYPELLFSAIKKSGKTALGAMIGLFFAVIIGGLFAEIYCLSNDFEQSVDRVSEACRRMAEASPFLRGQAKVTANRITFTSTGSLIQACASDYAGFAGSNIVVHFTATPRSTSCCSKRSCAPLVSTIPRRKPP
jgi:hypothetical protein